MSRSPGRISASFAPSRARDSVAKAGWTYCSLSCLGGDRIDHPPVAVPDVDAHQLAVEVDDPTPLGGVQVDPLGMVDRDRVDGPLDRPGEERVLAREPDDLLGGHRAGGGGGRHRRHLGWRRGRARITSHRRDPRTASGSGRRGSSGSPTETWNDPGPRSGPGSLVGVRATAGRPLGSGLAMADDALARAIGDVSATDVRDIPAGAAMDRVRGAVATGPDDVVSRSRRRRCRGRRRPR